MLKKQYILQRIKFIQQHKTNFNTNTNRNTNTNNNTNAKQTKMLYLVWNCFWYCLICFFLFFVNLLLFNKLESYNKKVVNGGAKLTSNVYLTSICIWNQRQHPKVHKQLPLIFCYYHFYMQANKKTNDNNSNKLLM